jgi:hypothetical protein
MLSENEDVILRMIDLITSEFNAPSPRWLGLRLATLLLFFSLPALAGGVAAETPSAWPQAYDVQRDKEAGLLTLTTPYYTVQHDLKRGGVIATIRLTHGRAQNLLVAPFETRVEDASGANYTDLAEREPRVTTRREGLNEWVTVEGELRDASGRPGVHVKTTYEYRWGYLKIHKELRFRDRGFRAKDICPVSTVLAPSLSAYGHRDGLTELEGATPFSFGSCHWGRLSLDGTQGVDTPFVSRYAMFADAGVEGLEWFVSDDLAQWELQPAGKRGQGKFMFQQRAGRGGIVFSVSTYRNERVAIEVPERLTFDYYIGLPLLEGHAQKPWLHQTFNRNKGAWVSAEQIQSWAKSGIQTVHCHNDGDYYGDGVFWRDGSYPPYPDMEKYDKVIEDCHRAGIRVATYFSDKELHPSTAEFQAEFQEHGTEWGRMNVKGDLQHNGFSDKAEFGAQMCLHSGWLDFLKASIDRVLKKNPLDGVYYDWNVALLCHNPRHEKLKAGQASAGHWDIDELLNLMEWTRRRVGPRGLVIIHNTTTPMFATENFADYVASNEWGYGHWTGDGPGLDELPLEWALVGARPRGVISYQQLSEASPRLFHLFALESLLAGATPWQADPATFELYPVLKPIGDVKTCLFADWRNPAVTTQGTRCASAIYSRPGESWLVVGNMDKSAQEIRCALRADKLPHPLGSITSATLFPLDGAPMTLDAQQLTGGGVTLTIPADSAVVVRVR